jgi:hypothetical protein
VWVGVGVLCVVGGWGSVSPVGWSEWLWGGSHSRLVACGGTVAAGAKAHAGCRTEAALWSACSTQGGSTARHGAVLPCARLAVFGFLFAGL